MVTTTRAQAAGRADFRALPLAQSTVAPNFLSQLWAGVTAEGGAQGTTFATAAADGLPIEVLDLTADDATLPDSTARRQIVDLTNDDSEVDTEIQSTDESSTAPGPRRSERIKSRPRKELHRLEVRVEERNPKPRQIIQTEREERALEIPKEAACHAETKVDDQRKVGTHANASSTDVTRRKRLERQAKRGLRQQRKWDNAKQTLQTIRGKLRDSTAKTEFDREVERWLHILEAEDGKNSRKRERKSRSRLFRVLEIVRRIYPVRANGKTTSRSAAMSTSSSSIVPVVNPNIVNAPAETATEPAGFTQVIQEMVPTASRLPYPSTVYHHEKQCGSPNSQRSELPTSRPLRTTIKQESMLENHAQLGRTNELQKAQDLIWSRHQSTMQHHFVAKGLPTMIWTTKMAIQEKGFRTQVENERQVAEAKDITEQQMVNGTQACITDFGGTSFDTGFPADALWELSSTQLWQYYEGGEEWSQPGWIPGGYLRIKETRAAKGHDSPEASIVLDFGDRAFTAEKVTIPRCSVSVPLEVHLVDHEYYSEFTVGLVFFQGGHVHVLFPALPLLTMKPGCNAVRATGKIIEFAGVFMGDAD